MKVCKSEPPTPNGSPTVVIPWRRFAIPLVQNHTFLLYTVLDLRGLYAPRVHLYLVHLSDRAVESR